MSYDQDNQTDPETSQGGLGGTSIQTEGIRDTRLIERALRERWPIPYEKRGAIVERQVEIATNGECSPRESTSAARCLVMMDGQNIEGAKIVTPASGEGDDPAANSSPAINIQINIPDNGRAGISQD